MYKLEFHFVNGSYFKCFCTCLGYVLFSTHVVFRFTNESPKTLKLWRTDKALHNTNLNFPSTVEGFAKSRPAAQRPAACHGPAACNGPAAWRPIPDFQSFLSSGKSTLMYRSASSLGMQNTGQKFMYDPMKCPEH